MHLVVRRRSHSLIRVTIICFLGTVNPLQAACTKTCVNGGVCNVVNGQQVCWCQSGFSGDHCEIQGRLNVLVWFISN